MQKNKLNIHFIGIGGIGLSSLARFYCSEGHLVSGSDENEVEDLETLGVKIYRGHDKDNIAPETNMVVYSSAILKNNPELEEAARRDLEIFSYPQALGELTKKYRTIAVSGTHGKSTTTSMLALVMVEAGLDPTVIVGTKLKEFNNSNFRKGGSEYLVIEADEFKAALLNYYPEIAVITNIEEDHLDYYKDLDEIIFTFQKYVKENLKGGILILNGDDINSQRVKGVAQGKVIDYSPKDDFVKLSVPGKHNIYNALAVMKVAKELSIPEEVAREGLKKFKGTWRRFEEKEIISNKKIRFNLINDYAHHPTEIRATIQAVKEKYYNRRIVIVFQPHQYERTYRLFDGFVESLSSFQVDKLLIPDIYTVKGRESEEVMKSVSSDKLAERIPEAIYSGNIEQTIELINELLQEDDILVIMGAGDIYKIEDLIANQ